MQDIEIKTYTPIETQSKAGISLDWMVCIVSGEYEKYYDDMYKGR